MSQPVGTKYWQAVTLGASLIGPTLRAPYNGHVWGTFTWTGTPTGAFALEARVAGGPWTVVPGAAAAWTTQPAGAPLATAVFVNWVNVPGDEFRIVYAGAGAGTVTAHIGLGDSQEG
jgi:hypothetical protein